MATRSRRLLLAVTLLLGALVAVALVLATPPADLTFAGVCGTVQLLMSVTLPFFGVLLAADLHRADPRARLAPVWLAAAALTVAVALAGDAVAALALGLSGRGAGEPAGPAAGSGGVWEHAGMVVPGSIVMQLVAQFVGTGLGLLLRRPAVAMLASIVAPLGLLLILGAVPPLRPVQAWLVPYPSAQQLLSGRMGPVSWARLLVVVVLWDVGLNVLGARTLRRQGGSAAPVGRAPGSRRP